VSFCGVGELPNEAGSGSAGSWSRCYQLPLHAPLICNKSAEQAENTLSYINASNVLHRSDARMRNKYHNTKKDPSSLAITRPITIDPVCSLSLPDRTGAPGFGGCGLYMKKIIFPGKYTPLFGYMVWSKRQGVLTGVHLKVSKACIETSLT